METNAPSGLESPGAESSAVAAVELRARRSKRSEAVGWILAIAAVLSWYGFWWFWLSPVQPAGAVTTPPAPRVTVLLTAVPEATSNAVADSRDLWSPVLFSLPSAAGFSRSALTNEIGARPPLDTSVARPVFLPRPLDASRAVVRSADGDRRKDVQRRLDAGPGGPVDAPALVVRATSSVVQVVFSGGLEGVRFQNTEVPEHPALRHDRSWEASLHVDVAEDGRVAGAFLENASASGELNAQLVRTVLAWRVDKPVSARSGTVTFRSINGPPLTEAVRQAVAP